MNMVRLITGTILVMLLLTAMTGCSGSGSDNGASKSGSLTGSGK